MLTGVPGWSRALNGPLRAAGSSIALDRTLGLAAR